MIPVRALLDWLLSERSEYVEHWSPERAQVYERATFRYLGIRPETIHPWSRKYRPKAKLTSVKQGQFKQKVG